MGGERELRLGLERFERRGRLSRLRRVGEDDGVGVADGEGVFDAQLVAEFGPDPGLVFQGLDQLRPEAVVPAAGIPDAQDEDRQRDPAATVRPSASTTSTVSGMAPRAWVAQLRQGS